MVRKMIAIGGDVDRRTECSRYLGLFSYWAHPAPLTCAASFGHKEIVRMVLAAEAKQLAYSCCAEPGDFHIRRPLFWALHKGHEEIALMLAREIDEVEFVSEVSHLARASTVLGMACEKVNLGLVRYILSSPGRRTTASTVLDRSTALYDILWDGIMQCRDSFTKPEIYEKAFQIAAALLQHKADPDLYIRNMYPAVHGTCRELVAMYLDPRVRDLIAASDPHSHPLKIGRTGYVSAAAVMAHFWGYRDDEMSSPWDYSDSELSSETSSQSDTGEEIGSGVLASGDQVQERTDIEKQLDVMETLSFRSLPPQVEEARDFWARKPASITMSK